MDCYAKRSELHKRAIKLANKINDMYVPDPDSVRYEGPKGERRFVDDSVAVMGCLISIEEMLDEIENEVVNG